MHQNYTRGPFVTLFYPWVIFNCPLKALLFTQFCAESAHFWHCSIKPEVIEELKIQTQKEFDIVNLFQPLGSQKFQEPFHPQPEFENSSFSPPERSEGSTNLIFDKHEFLHS